MRLLSFWAAQCFFHARAEAGHHFVVLTSAITEGLVCRPGDPAMAGAEMADDRGLYCSTAGTYFTNKDALADHYKSEFHR